MKERFPPLQGLYYFYVAAETGSFKEAAERLFVTAAAVSQQVRQLEEWLECPLFVRQHRKVKLTAEGHILFESSQKGFRHLQDGVRRLNQDPQPNRLAISTHPSFAQQWLIPRINRFRAEHPELALMIDPKNELVDFQSGLIDICIRYGRGNHSDCESVWLMDEILYPVCHRHYQQERQLFDIQNLCEADLIEDVWPDMNWSLWFETMKLCVAQPSIQYDGSQFVMDGALASQGVALVKHSLARRYVEDGKLVRIGNRAAKSRFSYYLCAPAGYYRREKLQQFVAWVQAEISQFNETDSEGINLCDLAPDVDGVVELNP